MNVIYILWLRQIKRYFRSKVRIIGSLGQPILFLLAFGFGFGPIFQKAGGGNYIQYLGPGIISMSILFMAVFSGVEMIWDRQFGFLKETLVAPVSRIKIIIGRTLGGATIASLQGLIVLALALLVGFRIDNVLFIIPAFMVMFLIALLFTSLGTAIACRLNDMQGFQIIVNFLIMPIFFFSGALFPLTGLPKIIGTITKINPLTYGVDALHHFLTNSSIHSLSLDLGVLVVVTLLILSITSYLFSKIQL